MLRSSTVVTNAYLSNETKLSRFAEAYLTMAKKVRYRPAVLEPKPCDANELRNEAIAYAVDFEHEEDSLSFFIGCSNFRTNRAFVYAIEAARLLAAGMFDAEAIKLLKMAIDEIEQESER